MFLQDKGTLLAEGSCSESQIIKVFIQEQEKNNTEMMCELLRQQAAPELEIDIFDGNPMDFH